MNATVVLASHNRPTFLRAALDSARAVAGIKNIVVVDDASDNLDVHRVIAEAVKTDHRVLPHFKQVNGGESATLNSGIHMAGDGWIIPLHDDDMLEPHGAELLIGYAEANKLDVVWGDAIDIDPDGRPLKLVPGAPPDRDRIWREDYFYFPAMVWHQRVHKRIGFFDESIVSNVDWDWKIRCIMECRCGYAPVTQVRYRRHPANKSTVNAGAVMEDCRRRFMDRLRRRYGR